MSIGLQIITLFVLSIPVACIAWTVTHEEIFKEFHWFFTKLSMRGKSVIVRKFAYMLTCEYCFSHYVTIAFLILTGFKLIYDDWRGYIVAGFSIVWIANIYMSLFGKIRLVIKKERIELDLKKSEVDVKKEPEDKTKN